MTFYVNWDLISEWNVRTATSQILGEPDAPKVVTQVPGPRSKLLLEDLNSINVSFSLIFYRTLFFL